MQGIKTSVKKYVKNGLRCPRCDSENINIYPKAVEGNSSFDTTKICVGCELEWVETHSITKVLITKV